MKNNIRFGFRFNSKDHLIVSERIPGEGKKEHMNRVIRMMGAMIEISEEKNKSKHSVIFEKYHL
jgi:hypothetical protein